MIDITGPPSTISTRPRPQPMPQRLPRPARNTIGRNAMPDHRKRCISKSDGVNPSFRACRVATNPSAQHNAAPTPQAIPSSAVFGSDRWEDVSAPRAGWFIADAYVSERSGSTHGSAGLTGAAACGSSALATFSVMAGLIPSSVLQDCENVDARHKAGHDERGVESFDQRIARPVSFRAGATVAVVNFLARGVRTLS